MDPRWTFLAVVATEEQTRLNELGAQVEQS